MNFYFQAANVLDRLETKQGSIQSVISTVPEKNRKRTAALVIETLKYKTVLNHVVDEANLLKDERKIKSRNLALVLVHDLLLSGGIQAGDGPVKQAILRHKTRLNGEYQKIKVKRGAISNLGLAETGDARAALIPRYVRVNTSAWTVEEAIQALSSQGFTFVSALDPRGFDSKKDPKAFSRDIHITDILLFSPQTQFHENKFYKEGNLILQDKASCFPAAVLSPPASDNSRVIDATAAPGNKTSHLSALMCNKGKLYAFERDHKRFCTLQMMVKKAGCQNVEPVHADFLTIKPSDAKFRDVTHILLDPSCSGSGIVNRLDYLLETAEENEASKEERLAKLASFQLQMVKHAMKFPSAERIVYSTCSIHATENENVVRDALKSDEALREAFFLAPRCEVLPSWERRGIPEEMDNAEDAQAVLRCSPGEDATNGFFVACFVRARRNTTRPLPTTLSSTNSVKRKKSRKKPS